MSAEKIKGRQKTFAERVAEGHTATEAYLLAGYRPVKRETAHRAASRLSSNPAVRTYIRELRRSGDELAREETTLTIAKKLAFLARIVLTSAATLREDDPLIQAHRLLKDGSASIRIPCKLKALKMHSELAGHFLPEPAEQPAPIDTLQELFDQIRSGRFTDATGLEAQETDTRIQANPQAPTSQCGPTVPQQPLPPTETVLNTIPHSASPSENDSSPTTPASRANSNLPPEQNSEPLQTTTNPTATIQPTQNQNPGTPLTPVQIRKMMIAQIQQSSPLNYSIPHPPPILPDLKEPLTIIRP